MLPCLACGFSQGPHAATARGLAGARHSRSGLKAPASMEPAVGQGGRTWLARGFGGGPQLRMAAAPGPRPNPSVEAPVSRTKGLWRQCLGAGGVSCLLCAGVGTALVAVPTHDGMVWVPKPPGTFRAWLMGCWLTRVTHGTGHGGHYPVTFSPLSEWKGSYTSHVPQRIDVHDTVNFALPPRCTGSEAARRACVREMAHPELLWGSRLRRAGSVAAACHK